LIEVRGFDLRSKEGLRLDEGTTGLLKRGVVDLVGKRSRAFGRAEDRADVGDGARNLTLLGMSFRPDATVDFLNQLEAFSRVSISSGGTEGLLFSANLSKYSAFRNRRTHQFHWVTTD
jgi:hypothetical protein